MRRTSLAAVIAVAAAGVLLGLIGNVAGSTVHVPSEWVPLVWLTVALLGIVTVAGSTYRYRANRLSMVEVSARFGLEEAANLLASSVSTQWRREEERRLVHDPFPLPVRWHSVHEDLVDHWTVIRRGPSQGDLGPLILDGRLDQFVEIYRRIPSGRLAVLGKAGAGKTILTIRFVLDLLDTRTPSQPIPVIFTLSRWNPTTPLRDWLTSELIRGYPWLGASGPHGQSLAADLVNAASSKSSGLAILPVLDGFDEIASGLHNAALEELNVTSMPLLLTSRPEEYAAAVGSVDALTAAAGIELDDLGVDDLSAYLPFTTRKTGTSQPRVTVWDPVMAHLRERPKDEGAVNLTTALSNPLMVSLARTIYNGTPKRDPAILLDVKAYPTVHSLEEHFLGAFVAAAYPDAGRYGRAPRWLHYMASRNTRDIGWWTLGSGIARTTRVRLTTLANGIAAALVTGLIAWLTFGPRVGLVFGAFCGLAAALLNALFGKDIELIPAYTEVRFDGWLGMRRMLLSGLGYGLVGGLVIGIAFRPVLGLVIGLLSGLTFGLVVGLWPGLSQPAFLKTAASPAISLSVARNDSFAFGLVFGLGSVLSLGVGFALFFGLVGLLVVLC